MNMINSEQQKGRDHFVSAPTEDIWRGRNFWFKLNAMDSTPEACSNTSSAGQAGFLKPG